MVAIIDAQSMKTALKGGGAVATRAKTKGRKRHIAVDTEGNLLAVVVHSAGNRRTTDCAMSLLKPSSISPSHTNCYVELFSFWTDS